MSPARDERGRSDETSADRVKTDRQQISPSEEGHKALRRDHPLEEAQKSYHTILEQQIEQANEELERPAAALLLSAFTAGLDLGFGPFAMAVLSTLLRDVWSPPVRELLNANLYAIGFVFVVLGRSALFTEHTTSAVIPVLARRASLARMLRLWALVLTANVAGGALFAYGAVVLGEGLRAADAAAFGDLARRVVDASPGVMFLSAVAAGWIMGLLTWLTTAARDTASQLLVIWLATFVIGLVGLHHSIAGTVEVLQGVFAGAGVTVGDFARFLGVAVAGNAVGGAFFVALLKFGQVKESSR